MIVLSLYRFFAKFYIKLQKFFYILKSILFMMEIYFFLREEENRKLFKLLHLIKQLAQNN
jgi:hypothetical protein